MIRVFIGFDQKEVVAYNVLQHSINRRSSSPVSFSPINLKQLKSVFKREKNPLQSTEFSFSRFLVPYLCNYEGWAIFMDCDMLCLSDISKLWDMRDDQYALMCVKHDHEPKEKTKFLGNPQTTYPKKNWSSMMLINCSKCKALTPDYVNSASGLDLHRFNWLENDDLIGEVPLGWNFLVDYNAPLQEDEMHLLHYTSGGPYFDEYRNCSYSTEWRNELESMNSLSLI